MARLSYPPLAVYIHWPFCKAKCPYCDFNSHVREHVDVGRWRDALLRELDTLAAWVPERYVQSIFLGGGTPSLMPPELVAACIQRISELWPLDLACEITLEANPTSVETDSFEAFMQAGVNRFSIGVQSLDPVALTFLGRQHSVDEALKALEWARASGARYSFDLIYARPGQTVAQWDKELAQALPLSQGHLSLYQLTIEEQTAFHAAYARKEWALPPDELAVELYEMTRQQTEAHGLYAYEVSNYAAIGQESRHNLAYWRGQEYLGIGPGAHGRLQRGAARIATAAVKSPERWLSAVAAEGHGLESSEVLTPEVMAQERVMMGLRLAEGIPLQAVAGAINERQRLWAVAEGLLEDHAERLIATPRGRLLLNALTALVL